MTKIEEIVDYIINFDKKNISFSFLFAVGRSASTLITTLLDSHEEVLIIPRIFNYYCEGEIFEKYKDTPEMLITNFHYSSSNWDIENLGENKDEKFEFKRDEITKILHELLAIFKTFDRKTFLLSIHFAYAKVYGIDLSKIKTILLHHHYSLASFGYKFSYDKIMVEYLSDFTFIKDIISDFPDFKIIHSVRNPFDNFNSTLKSLKNEDGFIDINSFYYGLYGLLFGYHTGLKHKKNLQNNSTIVKFEDLHLNTHETMKSLSDFLNIEYSDVLLKSTVNGKLWWGNNPARPLNGTNPTMVNNNWENELGSQSKILCAKLFNNIAEKYGYNTFLNVQGDEYSLIEGEFESYILAHLKELDEAICFSDIYLSLRENLIKYYSELRETGQLTFKIDLDKPVKYKENKFFIRKSLPPGYKPPSEEGTVISLQSWKYWALPIYLKDVLNKYVDKVWVTGNNLKESYISSGVNPEKVETINHGINTKIYRNDVIPCKLETKKSFKFLFVGSFYKNSSLDLLLNAYRETFTKYDDVCLVIRNTDIDKSITNIISTGTALLGNYFQKHATISALIQNFNQGNNPQILLYEQIFNFENYDSSMAGVYTSCDCFVYPYKTENSGKQILEAMSCGLPVITTKGGISQDFCNEENSYLIDSSWNNTNINKIQNIELTGNMYQLEPDKASLKVLLKHVFYNRNEAKEKGNSARKNIVENFGFDTFFKKIETLISGRWFF